MTSERFKTVPNTGWALANEAQLAKAIGAVREALWDDGAPKNLTKYFLRDGNYAGATFLDLDPVSPWDMTTGDLLAVTLLSVQAPPYSVRRLLQPSPDRNLVLHLLSEQSLPLDADLAMADAAMLSTMAELHEALKACLSPPEVKHKNAWVTASKLCARKRPDLFPVRDSVVCDFLGLGQNYQVDWQVFRHIIQDDKIRTRIDDLADQAAALGADIGSPNRRLRLLDASLWMHARRGGTRA